MHRRFRPRACKSNQFQARDGCAKQLGQLRMQFGLIGASCSPLQSRLDGFLDSRITVTQESRSVTATEIDQLMTIQVPESTPFCTLEEQWVTQRLIEPC